MRARSRPPSRSEDDQWPTEECVCNEVDEKEPKEQEVQEQQHVRVARGLRRSRQLAVEIHQHKREEQRAEVGHVRSYRDQPRRESQPNDDGDDHQ